ncbi:hypothetical protein ONE56_19675 [Vibrio mytili]|uniref:hypothetical protein n=1 Tax=Vibrio mytili TaxID=50718 RepID=UPI003C6F62B5
MAIQQKHTDLPPRYESKDFTDEQRHRFTEVANAAQKRRDRYRRAIANSLRRKKASSRTFNVDNTPSKDKPRRTRRVIALIMVLVLGLLAMYLF